MAKLLVTNVHILAIYKYEKYINSKAMYVTFEIQDREFFYKALKNDKRYVLTWYKSRLFSFPRLVTRISLDAWLSGQRNYLLVSCYQLVSSPVNNK